MRRILLVALALMGAVLLSACSKASTGEKVEEENVFRVGLEAGYPPFNWTQMDDSNGAVPISDAQEFAGGYDVEIAKE